MRGYGNEQSFNFYVDFGPELWYHTYMKKITKGMQLILVYDQSVATVETVEKVGRKYFYLSNFPGMQFDIETLREVTDYMSDYTCYLSHQDYQDSTEQASLKHDVLKYFRNSTGAEFSLDQLRRIYDIIREIN